MVLIQLALGLVLQELDEVLAALFLGGAHVVGDSWEEDGVGGVQVDDVLGVQGLEGAVPLLERCEYSFLLGLGELVVRGALREVLPACSAVNSVRTSPVANIGQFQACQSGASRHCK